MNEWMNACFLSNWQSRHSETHCLHFLYIPQYRHRKCRTHRACFHNTSVPFLLLFSPMHNFILENSNSCIYLLELSVYTLSFDDAQTKWRWKVSIFKIWWRCSGDSFLVFRGIPKNQNSAKFTCASFFLLPDFKKFRRVFISIQFNSFHQWKNSD